MEKEKYPEGYVDVKSICPNWDTTNFLDFMDLKLEDLKDKNITSIGGGFGIFEMDAAKNGAKVIVVDPILNDKDCIAKKLQENIKWMKENIKRKSDMLERIKCDVFETLNEISYEREIAEYIKSGDWYDWLKINVNEDTKRYEHLLKHLNNWEINQKKYGLVLNPSSGDKIEGIDTASQDIVVISHTLGHIFNKSFLDIVDFLEEALKILKPGGKLYIIDYVGDIPELEKILEKTDLKRYYKVNKGSFVCCFDKEGLSKFLRESI